MNAMGSSGIPVADALRVSSKYAAMLRVEHDDCGLSQRVCMMSLVAITRFDRNCEAKNTRTVNDHSCSKRLFSYRSRPETPYQKDTDKGGRTDLDAPQEYYVGRYMLSTP